MINNTLFNIFIFIVVFLCNSLSLFKNPIYSVFCFLNIVLIVTLLLFSLRIYYLSLILLIIYAGGIIVLFLFLIITLVKNYKAIYNETLVFHNIYFLFFIFLVTSFFLSIINSKQLIFLNLNISSISTYSNLDVFIFNLNYSNNDILIISQFLFKEYFFFLLVVILLLFFVLLSVIVIIKRNFVPLKTNNLYFKTEKFNIFNS